MKGSIRFLAIAFFLPCLPLGAETIYGIAPLFGPHTALEPGTTEQAPDALVTHIADRVRDRHAREAQFQAYDHYLPWYWEERTLAIKIEDRVAMGGDDITVSLTSLTPLDGPNLRFFFHGGNTVAEYAHNTTAKPTGPNRYSSTVSHHPIEKRPIRTGDRMEFEIGAFLDDPMNGRSAYYSTALLYVVGQGIVPWEGRGEKNDSFPLPEHAWLGGLTTLPYQYSNEPRERFSQMAGNISPASAQPFMLGRRLHHTDFGNGEHSEGKNVAFDAHKGKLGPHYSARSCIACHGKNGRGLPPAVGQAMHQSVIRVGSNADGAPHAQLGSMLQSQSTAGAPEATASIARFEEVPGAYGDGTPFTLRKPIYQFSSARPEFHSVRLAPQLVGMGLLEAISEREVLKLADPEDEDGDGISGRAQVLVDPAGGQARLGRFGYKAGQARLRDQIAHALNHDMGVTTSLFPRLEEQDRPGPPELDNADLDHMTRYLAVLGVPARRELEEPAVLRGEALFAKARCIQCHQPELRTSPHHPAAELRGQRIRPYTDLLLHDMGPGLADPMGEGMASGSEWRTAPLWGVGLTRDVSGEDAYLHDGRARSLEEAILWHGGEAEAARESFRTMEKADRESLIRFLKSL